MKIPFFYLEAGRLEIFQPQNTELLGYSLDNNNTPIYSDGVLLIKSHGFPAFENRTLYLNGRQGSYSFNFLINSNYQNQKVEIPLEPLDLCKHYNVGFND